MGTGEFGTESVRANIEPEAGGLASIKLTSPGAGAWGRFFTTTTPMEGCVIKAGGANTGDVRITGPGGSWEHAYPLDAGETVSIAINDLSKLHLYFTAAADVAYALIITHTGD